MLPGVHGLQYNRRKQSFRQISNEYFLQWYMKMWNGLIRNDKSIKQNVTKIVTNTDCYTKDKKQIKHAMSFLIKLH